MDKFVNLCPVIWEILIFLKLKTSLPYTHFIKYFQKYVQNLITIEMQYFEEIQNSLKKLYTIKQKYKGWPNSVV